MDQASEQLRTVIREEQGRDRIFKQTIVNILERHHLASAEESDLLRGLLNRPA